MCGSQPASDGDKQLRLASPRRGEAKGSAAHAASPSPGAVPGSGRRRARQGQNGGATRAPPPSPRQGSSAQGAAAQEGGGCRSEGSGCAEMSSVTALDSLAASLPPASVPKRSLLPPPTPNPPCRHPFPRSHQEKIPGSTEQPSSCRGAQNPAGHPATGLQHPRKSGEPFAPQEVKEGGGSPGSRIRGEPPCAWAGHFGKRMQIHGDCYDNRREGGKAALTFQRNLQRRKQSTESQLASITPRPCSASTPGPPQDTTGPASPRCCSSPGHRIIHLLLPKKRCPQVTAMPGGQPGASWESTSARLRDAPSAPGLAQSGPCQEGGEEQPGMGTVSSVRAGDVPTQRHYHSQTTKIPPFRAPWAGAALRAWRS